MICAHASSSPLRVLLLPGLLALGAALTGAPARAGELAEVEILTAPGSLHISVENTSGSPWPEDMRLEVTSGPLELHLSGEAQCYEGASLTSLQVLLGQAFIVKYPLGTGVLQMGWSESDPETWAVGETDGSSWLLSHSVDYAGLYAAHDLNLFGLDHAQHPAYFVHSQLLQHLGAGGSAADFLRTDQVFEASLKVNVGAGCTLHAGANSPIGAALDTREIDVLVFYKGDPNISSVVVGGPDDLQVGDQPAEVLVSADPAEPDPTATRVVEAVRYEVYDPATASWTGELWTGWVTWPDAGLCRGSSMAVTPDGACVEVVGCVPAELTSCRVVDGCCAGL
jgi:hypothetical protein